MSSHPASSSIFQVSSNPVSPVRDGPVDGHGESGCVRDVGSGRTSSGLGGNQGGPGVVIGRGVDDIAQEEIGEGTRYVLENILWG